MLLESETGIPFDLPGCRRIRVGSDAPLRDNAGLFAKRYDTSSGAAYLLRPDGYVAGRFRNPTRQALKAAMTRAMAHPQVMQ